MFRAIAGSANPCETPNDNCIELKDTHLAPLTGGFGRSRATRTAVVPESVQQMIADRSSVSAICRAASAMARAALGKANQPLTHAFERDGRAAVEGALEAIHREREGASAVEAAGYEHR